MKLEKKQINSLKQYFFHFFFIISLMFLIATSNTKDSFVVNNINTVKALESSRIEQIDTKKPINLVPTFTRVTSIQELNAIQNKKIEFTGTLTGYGPDCVGCSGIVGCPPYQNVKNGNIYYEDSTYGKIRIVAADKSIPCGSIIKISNYPHIDGDFYGIVLDRGSAINGLTMDLLYESEQNTIKIGRTYNINFKIERWGF
ncbi:MAG: 3D domain-containing protein [Bacilli bacterium]|nr:3D domain-containing protein [Bacilli bacterium]